MRNKTEHFNNLIRLLKDVIPVPEGSSVRGDKAPDGYQVVIEDKVDLDSTTVKIPEVEVSFNFCNKTGKLRYINNWQE